MTMACCAKIESRRGLTLVEMLITLSLLSVLVLISVSWMTTVISRQNRDQHRARWDRSAVMVLDQVDRDLMQIELIDESRRRGDPRVWIGDGALHIRTTKDGRVTTVSYIYQQQSQLLERVVTGAPLDESGSVPLIGEVHALRFELRLPDQQRIRPELHLAIDGLNDRSRSRIFVLHQEDVRQ